MDEYTRKLALLGIGIASLTREKAEEIVSEFVESGDLSEKDGRKMVTDIMKTSTKQTADMEKKIETHAKKAAAKLKFATVDDIKKLERRIAALEKKPGAKKKKKR